MPQTIEKSQIVPEKNSRGAEPRSAPATTPFGEVSGDGQAGASATAGRSSWKGVLRLSLVSIPVKAYTAAVSGNGQLRLNQLHHDCHCRIKYQKVCPVHGEIPNDQIVSGYEYASGQYVVVDPKELDALRAQSEKTIHIDTLVPVEEMDPLQLTGKDYYLTPDGVSGQKGYALLRQALLDEGLCGIARAVWHGKEQLVMLCPRGRLIVMSLLKYALEVKAPSVFEREVAEVAEFTAEELQLTQTLVQATTARQFDFSRYTNQYQEKLAELIEAKVSGQELVAAELEEPQVVINLMEALKASVAKARETASQPVAKRPSRTRRKAAVAKRKLAASTGKRKTATRKKKSG